MPHASEYHDDGIYYVSAKSMAESGTFAIESLPNRPAQTKYPPLWPAVLAIAWAVNPHYPDNLPVAMFLCWIWLPLTLLAYRRWLHQAGASAAELLLLPSLWALNPYVILFSTAILSEVMFTFLLLAALLCLQEDTVPAWAVLAGAVAGLAFLTRTAGIALLPVGLYCYFRRNAFRHMGLFLAGMLPCVAGWALWSILHRSTNADAVTLYYTNYFGYYLSIFQWKEAHLYAWKNLDGMIHSLGAFLLPDVTQSLFEKVLAETIGIAGIAGVVRLVREKGYPLYLPYALFTLVYALMLVIWHFPPNERLLLPVAPLWIAGLCAELKRLGLHIAQVFRKPETGQKIAGGILASALALLLAFCGLRQWMLLTQGLPTFYEDHARRLEQSEPAMAWIRTNLPPEARILSENDPLLYLRTGRQGCGLEMILTTIHWYREDHAARTADHAQAPAYAQTHNLDYFVLNDWDYGRDMPAEEQQKLLAALRTDARLELLYSSGTTSVYRVR